MNSFFENQKKKNQSSIISMIFDCKKIDTVELDIARGFPRGIR